MTPTNPVKTPPSGYLVIPGKLKNGTLPEVEQGAVVSQDTVLGSPKLGTVWNVTSINFPFVFEGITNAINVPSDATFDIAVEILISGSPLFTIRETLPFYALKKENAYGYINHTFSISPPVPLNISNGQTLEWKVTAYAPKSPTVNLKFNTLNIQVGFYRRFTAAETSALDTVTGTVNYEYR